MTEHSPPKSCRDYFIADGRHVGDYEGMYRDCSDPWRIEELGVRLDMKAALLLLECSPPTAGGPEGELRVLDAGAGAGLFSLALFGSLRKSFPKVELTLTDVSPTALSKAAARFREACAPPPAAVPYDLRLLAGGPAGGVCHGPGPGSLPAINPGPAGGGAAASVPGPGPAPGNARSREPAAPGAPGAPGSPVPSGTHGSPVPSGAHGTSRPSTVPLSSVPFGPSCPFAPGAFDLIALAQSLWGIVLEISGVLKGFKRMLARGGTLLVSQHFPGKDRQRWGREVAGPGDFSGILRASGFELVSELETDRASNHHWGATWRSI
ncbi:MAG: hypothetical protein LBQ12_08620 [Deltaproteobacteria bacterium]|nr:hypothetical protein [Deltaproteobacteria bacterium]